MTKSKRKDKIFIDYLRNSRGATAIAPYSTRARKNAPIATDIYYIVPNKCTECQGFHEEPQCAAVCPVDCCVPDEMYRETVDDLMAKKGRLHI